MCMDLKNGKIDKNHSKVNSDGYLVGYKVINDGDHSFVYSSHGWKEGLNRSNRRTITISKREKEHGIILKGFHIFVTKKAAISYIGIGDAKRYNKTIKVYYKPTDIVSYGYTEVLEKHLKKCLKTVVVTKCMVKSLEVVISFGGI